MSGSPPPDRVAVWFFLALSLGDRHRRAGDRQRSLGASDEVRTQASARRRAVGRRRRRGARRARAGHRTADGAGVHARWCGATRLMLVLVVIAVMQPLCGRLRARRQLISGRRALPRARNDPATASSPLAWAVLAADAGLLACGVPCTSGCSRFYGMVRRYRGDAWPCPAPSGAHLTTASRTDQAHAEMGLARERSAGCPLGVRSFVARVRPPTFLRRRRVGVDRDHRHDAVHALRSPQPRRSAAPPDQMQKAFEQVNAVNAEIQAAGA